MTTHSKTTVLNFYGGPSSGKSTTAAETFALLKHKGYKTELVTEYAKDLTYEKRTKTLEDQLYVFAKQFHRLFMCADQVDIIVTDCPLLLNLAYLQTDFPIALERPVLQAINHFDNKHWFVNRVKPFAQYGRNQTEAEARVLDGEIKQLLLKHCLPFRTVAGDTYAADNIVSEYPFV